MTSPLPRAIGALLTFAASTAVALAQDECTPPKVFTTSQLRVIPGGNVQIVLCNAPGHPTNLVPGLGVAFSAGGASTTAFIKPYLSPDETHFAIEADADTGSTTNDNILLLDGALVLQEGTQAPFAPAGELWGTVDDDYGLNNAGNLLIGNNLNGTAATTSDDWIAFYDNTSGTWSSIAQEGGLMDAVIPALAGGTWDDSLDCCRLTTAGDPIFRADGCDGTPFPVTTSDEILLLPGGAFLREAVDVPLLQAGGTTNLWENFDINDTYVSADGLTWLVQGDMDGPTTSDDDILAINNVILLQENQPIPGGPFAEPIDLNGIEFCWLDNGGNWYARGNNDVTEQDWVVRNGVVIAFSNGLDEIVPGSGEHWEDTGFAACFFAMDGNGSGAWVVGGVTDNADDSRDGVIVLDDGVGNRQVVAREGDPVDLDGNGAYDDDLFFNTFGNDDVLVLANGDVLFTATLRNGLGAAQHQGVFRVTPGAATCVIRNGNGINTLGFECTTAPVLGGNWQLTTSPNPNTILTLMVIGVAPFGPVPFLGGEVLIDPTGATTYSGGGLYNLAVPNVPFYQGVPLFLQAVRFDNVGGGQTVIMNAIDAVLGS
ncbi:MAG: hypothetical protein AB7O97_00730 [Planctomycetota bacterium]